MTSLLALDRVTVRAGGRSLIHGIQLSVQAGEFVALVGPNGSGKSTLLRAVLGLQKIHDGSLLIDGRDAAKLSGRERAAMLGWLPQDGGGADAIPVIDAVVSGRFRFDESRTAARRAALVALQALGVEHLAERAVNTLSGGETQRVNLAVMKAQEPEVFLLDEPANHLDPAQQIRTYETLGAEWAHGRTVVCVTHDINLLWHVTHAYPSRSIRVIGLREGALAFDSHLHDDGLADELSALFRVRMLSLRHEHGCHFVPMRGDG